MRAIVVGSRGSALARRQAEMVMERLRELYPGLELSLRIVRTAGDRDQHTPLEELENLGGSGIFVKELEMALLRGEADMAVHSLKDLPTEDTPGLLLGAIPARGDVRDAFLSKDSLPLAAMPPGSRIGTGSLRRAVQLGALRPDLEAVPVRGNVDTRLRKLREGEMEGLLLAAAGLERLGRLSEATELLPPDIVIPAPGQGALAIQCREGDEELLELLEPLDHRETRLAVTAERAMLKALGGGCRVPIGAWGQIYGQELSLLGFVASHDGRHILEAQEQGPADAPEALGQKLAERLLSLGAGAIVAREGPEARAGWV
ncbi:MAG TPA: hydroxymethylbilane synthase [Dehalococcoidia bacterium]|nr:hydroxymethylbilane synthase [Dehalococcoidia bacterium]